MVLSSLTAAKYVGSPRGNGECGFCGSLDRHLWLALYIQTTNSGTDAKPFTAHNAHAFSSVDREKSETFSLPVHAELCGFHRGDGDARGGVQRLRQMRQYLHPWWYNRCNCRKCSGQLSVGINSRKIRRPSWSVFLLYWME